ncbi:hypothetical protein [Natrinema gelatinilyticum]|uniref:hypothetical protein n=1 Tax=Natrinema gelatinilyticum TaxID=2961571 RepID=UPI0020C3C03B|nr:hypothetical protein [Natrinema gelatinilyticum]
MENPFDAVEQILRGMVETEVDNRSAVEAVLVEQLGQDCVDRFLTLLVPVPLDGDCHILKAVLSDEDIKAPVTCIVLVVVNLPAVGTGTRLG